MNIITYTKNNNFTFKESSFGDIDSLIFCQLFYTKFEYVLDGEGIDRLGTKNDLRDFYKAEYFKFMFNDGINDNENYELLCAAASSRRYRNIKLKDLKSIHDESSTKQFAAICYEISDDTDYICFRGTDGTLLGWKEDFGLAFKPELPSQADAVSYIEDHYGKGTPGEHKKLYIGGHSKGGNLAIYAALMCDASIRERVIKIYSHDGPGFREDVAAKLNEVIEAEAPEIIKQVPQSSVIGMLLNQFGDYCVIKSSATGGLGQHSSYTWEIEHNKFVENETVTKGSKFVDHTLEAWLETADDDKRQNFIEALFKLFADNGIYTVKDLKDLSPSKLLKIKKSFGEFDEEARGLIEEMFKSLAVSALRELMPERHNN